MIGEIDHTDTELRQYLQNWATQQPLPQMGRGDLIRAATDLSAQSEDYPPVHLIEFPDNLLAWASGNCIDNRIVNLRPIY
jgi:hypothetical protein